MREGIRNSRAEWEGRAASQGKWALVHVFPLFFFLQSLSKWKSASESEDNKRRDAETLSELAKSLGGHAQDSSRGRRTLLFHIYHPNVFSHASPKPLSHSTKVLHSSLCLANHPHMETSRTTTMSASRPATWGLDTQCSDTVLLEIAVASIELNMYFFCK